MDNEKYEAVKFPTGTLVFGVILVVVAFTQLSRNVFSWNLDAPLFFITLVALAGIALVVSGVASARRTAAGKNPPEPNDTNQL